MTWQLRMTPEQVAAHNARVKPSRVHLADAKERNGKPLPKPLKDAPGTPVVRSEAVKAMEVSTKAARRLDVALPWPPTVNHYWKPKRGGGRYISDAGVRFRAAVKFRAGDSKMVKGRVAVTVQAYPPDKRVRDLDNPLKSLLDALTHAGLIEDDGLIDDLRIIRKERVKGGRVQVAIRSLVKYDNSEDMLREG